MAFKDLPDELLIQQCRSGSQDAYNVVFQRYFKSIFGYAVKFTRNEDIAEELAMDVMLRLWQKRADLAADTNLKAFLFKCIKNALVDYWRKKELETVPLLVAENVIHSRSADYNLHNMAMEQVYFSVIEALSPQCKEVFKMSREEEMTYLEIAKKMDISVNTVKGHMVAALKGLRLKLVQHINLLMFTMLAVLSPLA